MPSEGSRQTATPPAAELARGTAPAPAAERRALDSPPSNGPSSHAPPALARPQQKHVQQLPAAGAAAAQQRAFARLQPVCAPLLALRGDPGALAAALERLEEALPGVEPLGLAACLDYVLFPLMFTVDSAALLRASPPPGAAQGSAGEMVRVRACARLQVVALACFLSLFV